MTRLKCGWILSLGMAVGCGDDPSTTTDGGSDSAVTIDSGTDSGTPVVVDGGAGCGTTTEFAATINGASFCFPVSGATMPRTAPQQTIAVGATADGLSRTLTLTFPGPNTGVFTCAGGTAAMVYREVSATGHTGQNSQNCTVTVTEVGTGTPVIIRGTFSGVLPYVDGAAPHGDYAITNGRFAVVRRLN